MTYFGARYYDPKVGRMLSIDALADVGYQITPYAYSFNNPVAFTDPDGNWPFPFMKSDGKMGTMKEQLQFNGAIGKRLLVNAYQTGKFMADPVGQVKAFAAVAKDPVGTAKAIWNNTKTTAKNLMSDDPVARGEAFADAGTAGVDLALGSKGVSATSRMSTATKIANAVNNVSSTAKSFRVFSGQKSLAPNAGEIVDGYLGQMRDGSFGNQGGGGFIQNGEVILTEGNHKMNAAIKYFNETGDNKFMQSIIDNGNFTHTDDISKYGIKKYDLPTEQ